MKYVQNIFNFHRIVKKLKLYYSGAVRQIKNSPYLKKQLFRDIKNFFIGLLILCFILPFLLLFFSAITELSLYIHDPSSKGYFHIPIFLQNFYTIIFSKHLSNLFDINLILFTFGLYVSCIGLFFNALEIYFNNKKNKTEEDIDNNLVLETSVSINKTSIIVYKYFIKPIFYLGIFLLLVEPGLLEVAAFYKMYPDDLGRSNLSIVIEQLLFMLKTRLNLFLYGILFIFIITSPLIILRTFWTFGFWGSTSILALLSRHISNYLKIRSNSPIFSIIISLIGIILGLISYII